MNDVPNKTWKLTWPGPGNALLRLFLITIILLPLSWVINALLVGSWQLLENHDAESWRHFIEWQVCWITATGVVFLASISSLPVWLGWIFEAKNVRRFFFVLACLATLAALFYAEEDWRGRLAWKNYRQQLEAGGAQLDLAAFIPKPVPDEQNFASTPVVKSWFVEVDRTVFTNTTERFAKYWEDNYAKAYEKMAAPKDKSIRHFSDLAGWAMAFDAIRASNLKTNQEFASDRLDPASRAAAVPSVLAGLKTNEIALAELRDASARWDSRYPVFYDLDNPPGIFLPHLINVRDACRRLQLRACAELATGHADTALADVKLMFYLANSVKTEPFFISLLVRAACVQIALQPVWEGLASHAWSDSQLQEIQAQLEPCDFLPALKADFNAERAEGIANAGLVGKKGLGWLVAIIGMDSPMSLTGKFANWCSAFIPRGWYDLEKVNYCRLQQLQLEDVFDEGTGKISVERIKANAKALGRELSDNAGNAFLRHHFIASLTLPGQESLILRIAQAQTAVNEAVIACALERYRLANGQFPSRLEPLAPKFISALPKDVLSGESYKYRRTEDGQFILYSIGWNETDDNGTPGKLLFDDTHGDWVWSYPAK